MAAGLLPRLRKDSTRTALHVAAAVSLEEVFGQILADFAVLEPTQRVRAVFGASDELADHLLAGAPADLFLSADLRQLDRLQAANLVRGEQRVLLAENGLAVIGLANRGFVLRKPSDLAGNTALRIALAEPDCPLGSYTRTYLKGLQIYANLRGRALLVENSRGVVAAVRAGQADVGLAYSSDASRAEGCQVLFRARTRAVPISYGAAILNRGQDLAAAHALLAFVTSPASTRRFRNCGFLPVHARG